MARGNRCLMLLSFSRRGLAVAVLLLCLLALLTAPTHAASVRKEMAYAVDLAKRGLWHEAAHRFNLLLVRAPNHPRLWNNLAVTYEAIGRYDEAHEAYAKAVGLMVYPPEEMLANQEAFEAYYRVLNRDQEDTATKDQAVQPPPRPAGRPVHDDGTRP